MALPPLCTTAYRAAACQPTAQAPADPYILGAVYENGSVSAYKTIWPHIGLAKPIFMDFKGDTFTMNARSTCGYTVWTGTRTGPVPPWWSRVPDILTPWLVRWASSLCLLHRCPATRRSCAQRVCERARRRVSRLETPLCTVADISGRDRSRLGHLTSMYRRCARVAQAVVAAYDACDAAPPYAACLIRDEVQQPEQTAGIST
jgi:hypothetical protein